MTARDQWRKTVADACHGYRLDCIDRRRGLQYETALLQAGIGEILAIRLEVAYAPIFGTLKRIEGMIGVLADLRIEPWAPPARYPVMLPIEVPEFLR